MTRHLKEGNAMTRHLKEGNVMCKGKKWFLLFLLFAISIGIFTWAEQVQSQDKYPTGPIDIIVPFGAGGSTDLHNRVMATYMHKKWSVPVNVINKPGGNTVPGCLEVYHALPDGYTLLADAPSSSSQLEVVVKNLPFKVMDRTFIGMFSSDPFTINVPPNSPFKSLKDLEVEAKRNPGKFSWVSLGGTGGPDFVQRQFLYTIGVDVLKTKPVMVTSGNEGAALVAGGNVVMGVVSLSSSIPMIKAGFIRSLAVSDNRRCPDLPDVPTTAECGYPTVTYRYWMAISGPPKLPTHIVDKWDNALQEMVKDPEAISNMKKIGATPFYHNAHDTIEYIKEETKIVKELWGGK